MEITIKLTDQEDGIKLEAETSGDLEMPDGSQSPAMFAFVGMRALFLTNGGATALGQMAVAMQNTGGTQERFAAELGEVLQNVSLPMLSRVIEEQIAAQKALDTPATVAVEG